MDELRLTPEQVNGMLNVAEEVLEYANKYGNVGIRNSTLRHQGH